jgi:hypothetical protein
VDPASRTAQRIRLKLFQVLGLNVDGEARQEIGRQLDELLPVVPENGELAPIEDTADPRVLLLSGDVLFTFDLDPDDRRVRVSSVRASPVEVQYRRGEFDSRSIRPGAPTTWRFRLRGRDGWIEVCGRLDDYGSPGDDAERFARALARKAGWED